jgi:hypothetical protein
MSLRDRVAGELAYRRARQRPEYEERDLCELADHPERAAALLAGADRPSMLPLPPVLPTADQVNRLVSMELIGGGKILKHVPGMGAVYDWRDSPWTPVPQGGVKIKPIVFVQHIPVVPNMEGIADFVRLRDVLVAQGLMVQNATDSDGNVALFTPMDIMCWQARGANQFSCGTEHMHLSIGEEWTRRQLRAAAWLVNQAHDKHGIPIARAALGTGSGGIAKVVKRGQISHMRVSKSAGYNDRSDPGEGYDWEYVRRAVVTYRQRIADGTAEAKGFTGI